MVSPPSKKHFGLTQTKAQLTSIRSAIRLYNKLQDTDDEPLVQQSK